MPRYELVDGSSAKFWEINLNGDSFDVCFGRIGTAGTSSTKVFDSREKAEAEYNKMIKSKTKKGYSCVGESNSPAVQEATLEVEQAIFNDPTSEDAWEAYGQYLESQGDVRAELIALELSGGSDRIDDYYDKYKDEWLGDSLVKAVNKLKKFEEDLYEGLDSVFKLNWKYGHIISARVASNYEIAYEESCPGVTELLRLVINSPAAKFIQEITIGCIDFEGENYYDQAILAISKSGKIPSLRKLFIGDFDMEECEISWSEIRDVSKLYPVFPNLEELKLHGGEIQLGSLKHQKLKTLTLETGGLPGAAVKSVVNGELPELEELTLWFGTDDYGGTGDIDMLKPLLAGENYPKLKRLGLQNSEFENDIAREVATSEILKRIEVLNLSMGTMTDEGAQHILNNRDNFKHLKLLNLDENFISEGVCSQLREAFPGVVSLNEQEEPDIDGDEVYLYVSVSE